MKVVLPRCKDNTSVALKANYYKAGITNMIDTEHYPYGGVLLISKHENISTQDR